MLPSDTLRRAARLFPRKAAVAVPGERRSYAAVDERANRFANALAGLGLQPGERLAIVLGNGPAYWEVYFGAGRAGLANVPINTHLTPAEMAYIVADAEATALLYDAAHRKQVEALLAEVGKDQVRACLALDGDGPGQAYERLLSEASSRPPSAPVHEDDPCLHIYTSGTTGQPKGVVLSHRAMLGNGAAQVFGPYMRHDDVFLTATPLYHLAAAARIYATTLIGAGHYVLSKFDADEALSLVAREGVSGTLLVATMARDVLDALDRRPYDLRNLRFVTHGTSPTPLKVLQAIVARLPAEQYVGWGLTEGGVFVTALRPDEYRTADGGTNERLASVGRELVGAEVRLVDEAGREVAPGEPGEMVMRSDRLMTGYWKCPTETAEVLRELEMDGVRERWLFTGDVARADEDGFLYVVGRKKEMIISGGVNIYPNEVEQVLRLHPAVREAAVVGVPSERWGEAPRAFVVLHEETRLAEDELLSFCRERLARFKVPAGVEFLPALPRNSLGKVAKAQLAEPFWRGYNRRVN